MTEIELKFQVPAAARTAIAAAMSRGRSGHTRLQAVYFDTADRRFAAAGIAVRLRLEGTQWVQTAKAGDPHAMQRHEHNAPVDAPADGPPPALDLARHAGTPAGDLIARALGDAPLVPLYRTDIARTHRLVHAGAGSLEYALDIGEIVSGDQRLPVHELEIELVDGSPAALLDAAACWVRRHGLWLDTRSKAERGDRLSRGRETGDPVPAKPWPDAPTLRAAAAALLAHLLPNLSEVASGIGSPGHVAEVKAAIARAIEMLPTFPDADPAWATALASASLTPEGLREPALHHALLSLLAVSVGQSGAVSCNTDPSANA